MEYEFGETCGSCIKFRNGCLHQDATDLCCDYQNDFIEIMQTFKAHLDSWYVISSNPNCNTDDLDMVERRVLRLLPLVQRRIENDVALYLPSPINLGTVLTNDSVRSIEEED